MVESKKWHVLRVISGHERKVRDHIQLEINRNKWDKIFTNILVPTEKVYTIKNGKKTIKEKTLFPGYIYLEADDEKVTQEMWQQIRHIHGVLGFLGTLSHQEAMKLLGKADEMMEAGESMAEPFIINEDVRIIDGAFNDFIGTIEEINNEKKKLKVIVKIFGRKTPVEVSFMQVEKLT
ncbi:MAG: transcription termination/antitermination protein NusG [Chitinophagales bacterium]|nr:transcription termination/antitermination protein NusG [Chitinophagales bacterium]MDW8419707.1 transcription termination/antitermination protein NusG [Chitinophagales bacterium]